MALPRQLPTTHDLGPLVGPFISSGGAAYFIAKDDTAGAIDALKSADPSTTAFSVQDAANNPVTSTHIRGTSSIDSLDAYQVGDVLHVAVLSRTQPAMGDWEVYWDYFSFDMSDDTWDTSTIDSSVNSTAFAWDGSDVTSGQIRIMVRGFDGDIVIVGGGEQDTSKGTNYSTIYHAYYDGTWQTPTRIDAGTTENNARYPQLSGDVSSSGAYVATWQNENTTIQGRPVTGSTHSHGTVGEIGTSLRYYVDGHNLIVYNDGGTWRGVVAGIPSTVQINAQRFDPTSSTPFASETEEADITGADTPGANGVGHTFAYDPAEDARYCIYVVAGTPDSIKYVTSVNEATWGGATTHSSPANDTRLPWGHATVGTSPSDGSSTVIAFLYQDATAGTAYYDEISIAAGGDNIAVGPAVATWAGVAVAKTLGGVSAAANPAVGTWQGVAATVQAQNDVAVGQALGAWQGVPVAATVGGVTATAPPALGTWQGVPLSAVLGGLTISADPALGAWQAVLVGVSSGVTIVVGQALGSWLGVPLGLQATIDVPVGTALATWTGVPVSAVLGGLNISVTPAPGTWQGVAVTVSTATVKVAGPALGTWQGVALTAALGGLNVSAGQALGTWQGVVVTPQTGTIVTANPALGVWAGVQVVPSLGALIVPADPALGVWQSVNVPVSIAPLTIPAAPASGVWSAIPVAATVGGVTIPIGPSPGTWQGVQVVPSAGAQLLPVGIAIGTWEGVATPVFIAPRSFPMTAALATWIGVPVSSVLGAVLVPVGPALGTWVAGQAQVLFFVELLIEEGHSVDVLRAWAADAARDWASDAVRIYSSDE